MKDYFHLELPRDQLMEISSIGLAHMGDAVFELLVLALLCTGWYFISLVLSVHFLRWTLNKLAWVSTLDWQSMTK